MLKETQIPSESKGVIPVLTEIAIAETTARLREGADEVKERIGELFEDAVSDAKRMVKKGRYAAEDLMTDAEYKIKKAPFRSVSLTFAAGMSVGLFAGLFISRIARVRSNKTYH
jgi:ElaB/YqjD/DUF883 family membrane-anchored ribosome-binding protein